MLTSICYYIAVRTFVLLKGKSKQKIISLTKCINLHYRVWLLSNTYTKDLNHSIIQLWSIVLFCKSWERDQYPIRFKLHRRELYILLCYQWSLYTYCTVSSIAYFKSCKDFKWTKSSSVNGLNNFFLYGGHQLNNQNKEIKKNLHDLSSMSPINIKYQRVNLINPWISVRWGLMYDSQHKSSGLKANKYKK